MPSLASIAELAIRSATQAPSAPAASRLAANGRHPDAGAPRKRPRRRRPTSTDPARERSDAVPLQGGWVVVTLPAVIGRRQGVDVVDLIRAAWAPGVIVVIADMTAVVSWDLGGLRRLQGVHRELAVSGAELRLVVWTADLYAALQQAGVSSEVPVYANLGAALRAASWSPPPC